jgi:menaquinone-dependent protoporphyrinogen oxidase
MSRILIVYGSNYGQTERVAQRIAGILMDAGHQVTVYMGNRLPRTFSVAEYDGAVVAASVIMNHHQRYIRDFVRRSVHRLNEIPSAFVSVCGAGGDPPRARAYVDALLRETGWHPTVTHSFTGAVAYTQYGWLFRWVLKRISRQKGLPTDTSRDWDFTEWDEVERFAKELAVTLGPAPTEHPLRA